jgi:hypothetical protein
MAHDSAWAKKSRRYRREAEKACGVSNTEYASVEAIKSHNVLGITAKPLFL